MAKFISLSAGQAVIPNAFVAFSLFDPAMSGGDARLKLASQTFNTATGLRQCNKLIPEFRRL